MTNANLAATPPAYLFTNLISLTAGKFTLGSITTSSSTINLVLGYGTGQPFNGGQPYTGNSSVSGTGSPLLLGILLLTFDTNSFQ